MIARILAAMLGGYVLTTLASSLFAALLTSSRVDAVGLAMQLSFLIYTAMVIWVFSVRKISIVWLGLIVCSLLCFVLFRYLNLGEFL